MFPTNDELFNLMILKGATGGAVEEATAEGNPLVFTTDLARPLKSLLIPFTPQQSGTGDPSPSNIRSILPWNGLTVFGGGKNLLNPNTDEWKKRLETYLYINGVVPAGATARFTLEVKDDTADISGCYLGFVAEDLAESSPVNYRWVIENGTVKSDMSNLSSGSDQFQRRCSNVFIYPATNETVQKLFNRFNIMVELGTTATAYEPYKPITDTDIVFPSPVYGGEHEAVSGKLMANWIPFVFDGQTVFNSGVYDTTRDLIGAQINELPYTSQDVGVDAYCDKLVRRTSANEEYSFVIAGNGRKYCQIFCGRLSDHPEITSKDEAKAFVSNWLQNNPVTLVYSIPTPQEQTLTGEQITALIGNNTIWSDADGSMTATYLKKG